MAAPNIDMIAAKLRKCSLGGGMAPFPLCVMARDPAAAAAADTTLDLNSDVALPYHWEQCLDLKTGKIYYINWSTGVKSMEDPRKSVGFGSCSGDDGDDDAGDDADDEDEGGVSDEGDDSSEEEDDARAESDDCGRCSSAFSSSTSASSRDTIERGGTGRERVAAGGSSVLVAAGCRVCMMYVMIPKKAAECPRCGGRVLHFT